MSKKIISPISIDLGSKTTGVYFAHYEEAASPKEIQKKGRVYKVDKNAYTLLMASRTQSRHQRRGYDRKKMVKRLFKLIWCEYFKLEWNSDVQQSISFLLNRRGFTFISEGFEPSLLAEFPEEAFKKLPKEIQTQLESAKTDEDVYDFNPFIQDLSQDKDKLDPLVDLFTKETEVQRFISLISDKESNKKKLEISKKTKDHLIEKFDLKKELDGLSGKYSYIKDGATQESYFEYNNKIKIQVFLEKNPDIKTKIKNKIKSHQNTFLSFKLNSFNLETALEKNEFDMEADNTKKTKKDNGIKAHLHHLAFALYKTKEELDSGGRHRSKYFKEIKDVLNKTDHRHGYLKRFCDKLQSNGFQCLGQESEERRKRLCFLIGNLSNLELKPLRKYFNCKEHKQSDYWKEERFSKIFNNWILNEWRVDKNKNRENQLEGQKDWKNFRLKDIKNLKKVVAFFIEENPIYTIPPYQNNNNRRPPKCQSLILNPEFLDENYKNWKNWLSLLKKNDEFLKKYENEFLSLKSGKKKYLFLQNRENTTLKDRSCCRYLDEPKARGLQFIFDRVKQKDDFCLNEIYSISKKLRQNKRDKQNYDDQEKKLDQIIKNSKLNEELKDKIQSNGFFLKGSFLHLVCSYYKLRKRAKDGRIFIHPKYIKTKNRGYRNTGQFETSKNLLVYCNHKPRQKRYQSFHDLAAVFQISPKHLKLLVESTEDEKILIFLKKFKGLKTYCKSSAKEQKDHRGSLKIELEKQIRKKKGKLYELDKKNKKISQAVGKVLFSDLKPESERFKDKVKKFSSIFSFAQINNIAFSDRSGNSKTCSVCSLDNAFRMEMDEDDSVRASRLSAISTRVIDGSVRKLAKIVSEAIANEKWKEINQELSCKNKVRVPIIIESNNFQFEPDLKDLKSQKKKTNSKSQESAFKDKKDRIKNAGLCPINGTDLDSEGEIDHIIPRASKWGTLNDEANLIYLSKEANQAKGKKEYGLNELCEKYKKKLFDTHDNLQIISDIKKTIWNKDKGNFKFGQYKSFINLTPEEQIAFRHALFLTGDPLRAKVINAIDNRNQTFVNGTQRYFVQEVANRIYKKALDDKKEEFISFDYFGISANSSSHGESVYDVRKDYEIKSDLGLFKDFKKANTKVQKDYSHLIDAQIAFTIAASQHRNEGGLKLKIDENTDCWAFNKRTGEFGSLFENLHVKPDELETEDLKRRKAYVIETHYRQIKQTNPNRKIAISYKIHKDNCVAENFFPFLESSNEIFKGFSLKNSVSFKKNDFQSIKFLCEKKKNIGGACFWIINKSKAKTFLMDVGRGAKSDSESKEIAEILEGLVYKTQRKSVISFVDSKISNPTVGEFLESWSKKKEEDKVNKCAESFVKKSDFTTDGITLPFYWDWLRFEQELKRSDLKMSLNKFLSEKSLVFKKTGKNETHSKVRKVFSLPIKASVGNLRLCRKNWFNEKVFHLSGEESVKSYGLDGKGHVHTILSKNSIPTKYSGGLPEHLKPEPIEWIAVSDQHFPEGDLKKDIVSCEVKYKDRSRSEVRIKVSASCKLLPMFSLSSCEWEGKVLIYDKLEDLEKGEKNNSQNLHILKEKFLWFSKPFTLSKDRNNVKVTEETNCGKKIYIIIFTVGKKFNSFKSNETSNNL